MKVTQGHQEKSRLGRLLVNRGYISDHELDNALQQQRASGALLGEVLIASGWITERELGRVLKHQKRYRNAAALVAMVTLPLQPIVTLAASAPGSAAAANQPAQTYSGTSGFSPLSENEMSGVAGQGSNSLLARIARVGQMPADVEAGKEGRADAVEGLKLIANTFVPMLNFLDSDLTISGVHYRADTPRFEVLADGGLRLALPERIELIEMNDIRVSGSSGPSMGNVSLHDIRFAPASSMTIYAH
ncbi:pilus assembly protein PilB [Marinobacter fonticola]|uniref:pilus assembly protein PilB n=1 Tax=Marinobacter fonticola TaxID=2603215 RepID=UPI0011E6F54A|nr:pilus assembly protein PilB [Marinobacter fonticola]